MSAVLKPRFRLAESGPVPIPETPVQIARRRHGRPFCHESNSGHRHEAGPAFWTADRIAQLAAENDRRRKSR